MLVGVSASQLSRRSPTRCIYRVLGEDCAELADLHCKELKNMKRNGSHLVALENRQVFVHWGLRLPQESVQDVLLSSCSYPMPRKNKC